MKTGSAGTRHDWDVFWREVDRPEIDYLTRRIFFEMAAAVSFAGRTVLELGCGTGRLSLLALRHGAVQATLVDSSSRALDLARGIFRGEDRVRIIEGEIGGLDLKETFDVVFSSGVVEHFPDGAILEAVRAHRRHSRGAVVTVVPAGPHANNLRMRLPSIRRRYGWQRPLGRRRMGELFARAGIGVLVNRRFFPLYALPAAGRSERADRLLRPLDRIAGGLLLTAGTVRPEEAR